jgi:hypothetical protein
MNEAPHTPASDDHLRRALHEEAKGVEASDELLHRTLAAAARPVARPPRRILAAAAVASVAVVAAVTLIRDDGDEKVDAVDDPTTTTTTAPAELGDALLALFPCEGAEVVQLSLFVDADGRAAVEASLAADDRTLDVTVAEPEAVGAALAGQPTDGVLPVAIGATFANPDDELAVRAEVADLPGVIATSTTDCATVPPDVVAERPNVIALVRDDGMLMVVDLASGESRELYHHGDPDDTSREGGPYYIDFAELSADGRWVYFSTCCEPAVGNTYRIAMSGGEPEIVAQGAYPRVSPDGRSLATSGCQFLYVTPVDGDGSAHLEVDECIAHLAWSPDGRQLAATTASGGTGPRQVLLFDWDGSRLTRAEQGKPDNPGSFVSWTPDGILNTVAGGPVDDDRALSQDASYQWILWVDEAGVVRQQAGHEASDRTPIDGLPPALAADW